MSSREESEEHSPPPPIPSPEPLNPKSSRSYSPDINASSRRTKGPLGEGRVEQIRHYHKQSVASSPDRQSPDLIRNRPSFRIRASTSIAASTRNIGEATRASAQSVRFVGETVGDLVVPRFKLNWTEEIKKGGRCHSIAAFLTGLILTFGLTVVFLTFFSIQDGYYGFADRTFEILSEQEERAFILFAACFGTIFLLGVFDFIFAPPKIRIVGFIFLFLAICCGVVGTLFEIGTAGEAPILLFFAVVPLILVALKKILFDEVDNRWYMLSIAIALIINFIALVGMWTFWVFETENFWTDQDVEDKYFGFVGCPLNETIVIDEEQNITEEVRFDCPEAFIVWILPIVVAAYSFLIANVLTFTIRAENRRVQGKQGGKKVESSAQVFIVGTLLAIVAIWVLASVFASNVAAVSDEVLYLSIIFLATVALIVFSVFGLGLLKSILIDSPLGIKVVQFSESEWASAFVVFLLMPLVAVVLVLSFITQAIRKYTPLGKPLHKLEDGSDEATLVFTSETQWIIRRMRSWDLGSVLLKTLWIGVFWFVFVIGIGRAVNVFLSFLSELIAPLSLEATTAIFLGAGLGLFALPPVPGLPIYLTGGILLSQSAINNGFEFAVAGWYAVAICSVLKMLSIVMQQKFFGQILGSNFVAIRSACQLNSLELRAMKKIMAIPGITLPKVAVLVGGPDWPTSVLTGLMRLPLLQMLLGSIPVLLTIIPVCFAGAVLVDEDGALADLNAVLLSISLVVQLVPFFVAIHFIAKAAIDYADELENEPLDQEVLEYEKDNKVKKEWTVYLNKWKNLNGFVKFTHIVMCVISVVCNMIFLILGDEVFVAFEVTDSINETLDGNVANIVILPFGGIVLGTFSITVVYLIVFGCVQGCRVSDRVKKNVVLEESERPEIVDLRLTSVKSYSDHVKLSRRGKAKEYPNARRAVSSSMPNENPLSGRSEGGDMPNDGKRTSPINPTASMGEVTI